MLRKIKLLSIISLSCLSLSTQAAPIWGPWTYSHQDLDFNINSGNVVRCWYVRYKLDDPNYRDALRSFTLTRWATECPATPPFTI